MTNAQCRELAEAIRRAWVWNKFHDAICSTHTWRPVWRSGQETWECVPSRNAVLSIPGPRSQSEILTRIPHLSAISETRTLVLRDEEGLAGLHCSDPSTWPEEDLLRLFTDVALDSRTDEPTALWIDVLLTQLKDEGSLTSGIRDAIADLPLLRVRDFRTGARFRISSREWDRLVADQQLFKSETETMRLLQLLSNALPSWSCLMIEDTRRPAWFCGSNPLSCDAPLAARLALRSDGSGSIESRIPLFQSFESHVAQPLVPLAMRFLMHGYAQHASNDRETLFLSSRQSGGHIWTRLIRQLIDARGGEDSWRLLDTRWAPLLSPQLQQQLKAWTLGPSAAWTELTSGKYDAKNLSFSQADWSTGDICGMVQGLSLVGAFNRGQLGALLRRLPIHTIQQEPLVRVSIAEESGNLDPRFVLDSPGFGRDLPEELGSLWIRFQLQTQIVDPWPDEQVTARAIQRQIFTVSDAESEYVAELDWNYVVRRCLDAGDPSEWAAFIMEAFSRVGNKATEGVGPKLRETKWLPLASGGCLAPSSIIHFAGIEDDLHRLLDPERDGLAGVRALPEWLTSHRGFSTLRNLLPRMEHALEHLGLWLSEKPDWHLGLTQGFQPGELDRLLAQLQDIESLPIADLLTKLRSLRPRSDDEGIDALLAETVLPAISKSFDYRNGGLEKITSILLRLQGPHARDGFDHYLTQACKDGVIAKILPTLQLENQRGEWLPARQLIWPSASLDFSAQLCSRQALILQPIVQPGLTPATLQDGGLPENGSIPITVGTVPDFDAQAARIKRYIQPFRNGNIGDTLPAALVAVLGGHPAMLQVLWELLRSRRQAPDDFLTFLLGDKAEGLIKPLRSIAFSVDIIEGQQVQAASITGEAVTVSLTSEVTSLLVGDPADLFRTYECRKTQWKRVVLRSIHNPNVLTDAVSVFASTIETIVLRAHCNNVISKCPVHLKQRLGEIANAGQADLRRSQIYLLDIAEGRLKELGVRGKPKFDTVLQQFEEARRKRVEAEILGDDNPKTAGIRRYESNVLSDSAKRELIELLESREEHAVRAVLVEAVCRKLADFQYNIASIPLELFQNADDALTELADMRGDLPDGHRTFVLRFRCGASTFEVVHWGRAINQYDFPGFSDGLKRGYDQDLQKMLTLNFSDKALESDGRAIVTGRFGLGFKSSFLLAPEPDVVSGRLAFRVCGGFYPVPLPPTEAEAMRETAQQVAPPGALVPTVIRLKWDDESRTRPISTAVDAFARVSPLLTVFAREIRNIVIDRDGQTASRSCIETMLTPSGRVILAEIGSMRFLCFRCHVHSDSRPATVLFQLDPEGVSALDEDLSGIWVTTPTAERSELRWAVNAPFKPDAGRQRVALSDAETREAAAAIAQEWGEGLQELSQQIEDNWSGFASRICLHANCTPERWWERLWLETTRTAPVLHWDHVGKGGEILSWIAWNQSNGAIQWLVRHRAVVPTGLPGTYALLVRASDAKFYVSDLLAETANGCFAHVAEWSSMQNAFPPGQTIHASVKRFLAQAECIEQAEVVTLRRVLEKEVGPHGQTAPESAERVGGLFSECSAIFDGAAAPVESQAIQGWLRHVRMLAEDGQYHPVSELVCGHGPFKPIDRDEARRAAFAPVSAVLSEAYSETAIRFFVEARVRLPATARTLAEWTACAAESQLRHVFTYLYEGDLGQQLADELRRPWLEGKRSTEAWHCLSIEQRNEIERKFLKDRPDLAEIIRQLEPVPPPPVGHHRIDAYEAFQLISEWWRKEQKQFIGEYEQKTYPAGFKAHLPWPGEDGWDAPGHLNARCRWLLVFIHAALVPLGFNRIGRDQRFSQFLVSDNWLTILSKAAEEPEAVLPALDHYLDKYVQDTEHHFQMRQFVAFYAVAKHMESLMMSIREAEQSARPGAFQLILAPRANPDLTGSGIDAPPLTGMLGRGSCQLLRELYRLGRLRNPLGYGFAFTPIRRVRRLCGELFSVAETEGAVQWSQDLFRTLKPLGEDPTFNLCFDLPLQYLAQNASLRERVLRQPIDLESPSDDFVEGGPEDFES